MKKDNNDFTSEYLFDEDMKFVIEKKNYNKEVEKTSEYLFSSDEEFVKNKYINKPVIEKYSIDLKKRNKKIDYKRIALISFLALLLVFVFILIFGYGNNNEDRMISYCNNVYKTMKVNSVYDENVLSSCLSNIDIIKDEKEKNIIFNNINSLKQYFDFKSYISLYYVDGKINELLDDSVINKMDNLFNDLDVEYKEEFEPVIVDIKKQNELIKNMVNAVDELFVDSDKVRIKDSVTYSKYNEVVSLLDNVPDSLVKNEYVRYLEYVNEKLDNRRKMEIENAWIRLNIPYVSQNLSKVYNGCELASLLMSLKYKGYLKNMDLRSFASGISITDNPYSGFYLSIFEYEPRDITHWIAPSALIDYGINSSNYSNIIDLTGSNFDELKKDIINRNPVIIYLTYNFNNPKGWNNGVPLNLHVQLITGYNSITNEYVITDPYTRTNGKYEFVVGEQKLRELYNNVGKKAIVVR